MYCIDVLYCIYTHNVQEYAYIDTDIVCVPGSWMNEMSTFFFS